MADSRTGSFIQVKDGDWGELNRSLRYIYNQLNAITGNIGVGQPPDRTYTPVFTNPLNLSAAVIGHPTSFLRVLNTVIVYGEVSAAQDVANIQTSFEMSLPIPAKFINEWELGGTALCPGFDGFAAAVLGSVANQTANFRWVSSNVVQRRLCFIFAYQVS